MLAHPAGVSVTFNEDKLGVSDKLKIKGSLSDTNQKIAYRLYK